MRKDGWYWVRIEMIHFTSKWIICEYKGGIWHKDGCAYRDQNFVEIDEKQIKRD